MSDNTVIRIEDATRSTTIAAAPLDAGVLIHEGNYYFAPELVDMTNLQVSERTYLCPYKGKCNWIDLVSPRGKTMRNVAWVYSDPKPGYEEIKGRIAFYPTPRMATVAHREADGILDF
jgi:uncharacterized protein (DUF427 family)